MNYRMVAFVLGRIFAVEAGLMLFPLICAMLYGEWYLLPAFLLPAALLAVLGFITSHKTPKNTTIFARDGLAIVALVWVLMSAFGALPFVISVFFCVLSPFAFVVPTHSKTAFSRPGAACG